MDFKIPLACTLIVGGALGLFLPISSMDDAFDSSRGSMEVGSLAPGQDLPQLQQASEGSGWAEDVVLQRQSDGHFYADVRIDGRSYHMLVDTGASVVALSANDAAAMGIQWFEDEVSPVAQGAGGPVNGISTTIDRMSLGGHEANGVRAIVITEGSGISLLGQSFLSTIGRVEISGDRMILGT